jgi:hypothetical protein
LSLSVSYRFHLFNFLFALFNSVIGYIEIVKSINKGGVLFDDLGYFMMECSSLLCAHVIISTYVCCPQATLPESMMAARRRRLE